jgi:hypothetical protein
VTPPNGWTAGGNAFLAFGNTYATELAFAGTLGWLTRTIDGGHLHFLHQPAAVAAIVVELAKQLH